MKKELKIKIYVELIADGGKEVVEDFEKLNDYEVDLLERKLKEELEEFLNEDRIVKLDVSYEVHDEEELRKKAEEFNVFLDKVVKEILEKE